MDLNQAEFSSTYNEEKDKLHLMDINSDMFEIILKSLGTREQYQKYITMILDKQIIGFYAGTEMGHGSDIQATETEAKYNRTTKEFTINTPSNNAVKLTTDSKAEYGTHALLQAKLLCDGIQYGTHAFILPVRDP
jgi:acyl-CoA oxidase